MSLLLLFTAACYQLLYHRYSEHHVCSDTGYDDLRQHIAAVVQQAVQIKAVGVEAVPELVNALEDDYSAEEMTAEAHGKRDHSSGYPSQRAFFAENTGNTDHCVRQKIVQKYASYKHHRGQSPAEKTVRDALKKLKQREHSGNDKSL